jgi:hypothetical protein
VFKIPGLAGIKIWIYVVVPISLTATIAFGLHTVVAVAIMRAALPQSLAYLLHDRTMQDLFNGVLIEIAQHVGITGTAGFDITSGIDM